MEQNEKKDWSKEESWQIAIYKTDKALLELCDNLKPASNLFPAHIHIAGIIIHIPAEGIIPVGEGSFARILEKEVQL